MNMSDQAVKEVVVNIPALHVSWQPYPCFSVALTANVCMSEYLCASPSWSGSPPVLAFLLRRGSNFKEMDTVFHCPTFKNEKRFC